MDGVQLCAELLLSSRVKGMNDRIDEGCSLLYYLRVGHVAHSGHPSCRPSDVRESCRTVCSRWSGMLRMCWSWGYTRGLGGVLNIVDQSSPCVSRGGFPAHNSEGGISRIRSRKTTPEESDDWESDGDSKPVLTFPDGYKSVVFHSGNPSRNRNIPHRLS